MNNRKMFFKFVIPSILAFALSGVYTIVDGFFVGNSLGDLGLAAITLGYPIAAFIQALGTGIGLSGAIRFTIFRAQENEVEEKECFGVTVLLLMITSAAVTGGFLILLNPLLCLLGAEGEIFTLSAEYVRVIALGAVFQMLATGFVPFIRNMGGATFAMAAMILGFVTNIVLDYVFVWVLGLGMAGAAWATVIGQGMTLLAAVSFLVWKKTGFGLPPLKKLPGSLGSILKVSFAPFGLTFSPNITLILMNRFLLVYGSGQSVATYGCIAYITAIVYLLLQGVGDGNQPLISRYYGENAVADMRQIRSLAYRTGAVIAAACMVGLYLTSGYVGVLFGASAETNRDVTAYLPLFLAPLLFLSFVRITTAYFYATEQSALSYILVYAEPVSLLILLIAVPPFAGLMGVWLAVPLAQIITWFISILAKCKSDRSTAVSVVHAK